MYGVSLQQLTWPMKWQQEKRNKRTKQSWGIKCFDQKRGKIQKAEQGLVVGADSELFNSWELKPGEHATYAAGRQSAVMIQRTAPAVSEAAAGNKRQNKSKPQNPSWITQRAEERKENQMLSHVRVCPIATRQCQAMIMVATGSWPMLPGINCPVAVPTAPVLLWLEPPFNRSSPKVLLPFHFDFQNTFQVSPILHCVYLCTHIQPMGGDLVLGNRTCEV